MNEGRGGGRHIRQAWLVILLALAYGGALAGVETTLRGRIQRNKMNETYDRIPDLVPGADREQSRKRDRSEPVVVVADGDGRPQRVFAAVAADGTPRGWVLPASGQGFADRIELLIGVDLDVATITGLFVLDQKETPGLGNFITGDEFLRQFRGRPADRSIGVTKAEPASGGNQIRAITGATISSQSVADIVNRAIQRWKEPIRQQTAAP